MFNISSSRKASKRQFKKLTRYTPNKIHLYELALIPKSAALESGQPGVNNERLEYLGDAVLESVVSAFLFQAFPNNDEGFLTKIRSKFANRENLNRLGIQLGLDAYLKPSVHQNHHAKNVLGNILEALIGALYLDLGYKKTSLFVIRVLIGKFTDIEKLVLMETDFKSHLVEWSQKSRKPLFFDTREKDIGHREKSIFISTITITDEDTFSGEGSSKKEAEQTAAKETLAQLKLRYPSQNI